MPWTVDNPPRPSINWPAEDKKKCVEAANAVLREGGTEQTAIFACIRAAGRTQNPGGKAVEIYEAIGDAWGEFISWLRGEKVKKGNFKTFKQADGTYRYVGWISNHFLDNDDPPEILTGESHKEYVAWADKHIVYPELWLWHTGGQGLARRTPWISPMGS